LIRRAITMKQLSVWLCLLALASFCTAETNLIVNGGFEDPAISDNSAWVFTSIPGWKSDIGSGFEVQHQVVSCHAGMPYEGHQHVELDGDNPSNLYQTIATRPGSTYVLSFAYTPRPGISTTPYGGNAESNEIDVLWAGVVVDTISRSGVGLTETAWEVKTYSLVAQDPLTRLEFRDVSVPDGFGGYLDDVQLIGEPREKYSGGNGDWGNPYQISTAADWQELMAMPDDWQNKWFELIADIDLAGVELTPVGNYDVWFASRFEGGKHVIRNATLNLPDQDYVGLFGYVYCAQIRNLGLMNLTIVGRDSVGGLAGYLFGWEGEITGCYAAGTVTTTWGNAGGLVGRNQGIITACTADVSVSSGRYSWVIGGLCGWNEEGSIVDSSARGTVSAGDGQGVGGLCGQNNGTISRCYAIGSVSGGTIIGGLCGDHYGTIRSSYATGAVSGGQCVGGLVGENIQGKVIHCYSAGKVTGNDSVGGLCGYAERGGNFLGQGNVWDLERSCISISAMGRGKTTAEMQTMETFTALGWDFSEADGTPADWRTEFNPYPRLAWQYYSGGSGTQADPYQIGCAADWQDLTEALFDWDKYFILTRDIDFAGAEIAQVAPEVGNNWPFEFEGKPFTGVFDGGGHTLGNAVINLMWYGNYPGLFGQIGDEGQVLNLGIDNFSVTGCYFSGILCGENRGTIRGCLTSGTMNGNSFVGGLCGTNIGTIETSFSTAAVNGQSTTGGLCGENDGTIVTCYAKGTVGGYLCTGGLCGANMSSGILRDCYATGSVSGKDSVGGLVGGDYGSVIHCYSIGKPTGSSNVGGLCGNKYTPGTNDDVGNFWDVETSGIATSALGAGKTTAQMKSPSTFTAAGWDHTTIEGDPVGWKCWETAYPKLYWEPPYSGGSGTADDPYRISTVADWYELIGSPADWRKQLILTNDLDFSGVGLSPVASYYGLFSGVFDGNGHVLRNTVINQPFNDYVGLFGSIGPTGQIRNLGVENIAVTGNSGVGGLCGTNGFWPKINSGGTITNCYVTGSVSGKSSVGGLCGDNLGTITYSHTFNKVIPSVSDLEGYGGLCGRNQGTIRNCYTTGDIAGIFLSGRLGGLCGLTMNGLIQDCFATGTVTGGAVSHNLGGLCGEASGTIRNCYAIGTVRGGSSSYNLGGLCGENFASLISDCYATGPVSGWDSIGGLIGNSYLGCILHCYSTGTLTGPYNVGGLCGLLGTNGSYEDIGNFWDVETSGIAVSAMGTGKTTAQMKSLSTFTVAGWDYTDADGDPADWIIRDTYAYPRLAWEPLIPGDLAGDFGIDLEDLKTFALSWMSARCSPQCAADFNADGKVDLADFALFAEQWMK
jgi:hypothetical protein